jgi:hypothetical protein
MDAADRPDAEVRPDGLGNLAREPPDACLAAVLPGDPDIPDPGRAASADAAPVAEAILLVSGILARVLRGVGRRGRRAVVGARAGPVEGQLAAERRALRVGRSRQSQAELLRVSPDELA